MKRFRFPAYALLASTVLLVWSLSAIAESETVTETTVEQAATPPADALPADATPTVAPAPEAVTTETIVAPPAPEPVKPVMNGADKVQDKPATVNAAVPENNARGGNRSNGGNRDHDSGSSDHGNDSHHDSHDNNHGSNHGGGKPTYYHARPPRVIFVYPQTTQVITRYVEVAPPTYVDGYVPTYKVGERLPNDREWYVLQDYAAYSIPAPRVGEQWVYHDQNLILVSKSTAEILGAFVLAAPIR